MNTFNIDDSNITKIKIQHCQITTTITKKNRVLKFKPMIKKSVVADDTFFTIITFSRINYVT